MGARSRTAAPDAKAPRRWKPGAFHCRPRHLLAAVMASLTGWAAAASPDPDAEAIAAALAWLHSAPGVRAAYAAPADTFEPTSVTRSTDGRTHVHFTRRHAGLAVFGGDLVVHASPRTQSTGTITRPIRRSLRPSLTPAAAEAIALARSGRDDRSARAVGAELALWIAPAGGPHRLVWVVRLIDPRRERLAELGTSVIDANDGTPVATIDALERQTVTTGQGNTSLFGAVSIPTTRLGWRRFALWDRTHTTALDHGTQNYFAVQLPGTGLPIGNRTDVWGDGTGNDPNTYAADVMYSTSIALDYYARRWGRTDLPLETALVHFNDFGFVVAYSAERKLIVVSDPSTQYPIVPAAIDIIGHEVTHAAFAKRPGFIAAGESGGLSEASGDIIGTAIEFDRNDPHEPGDYITGGTVFAGLGRRYMNWPNLDNRTLDCWFPGAAASEIHDLAGPADHFFYLLAEGSADSPTCNAGDTTLAHGSEPLAGIGRDAAVRIWYDAVAHYLTSMATYADAREATMRAAASDAERLAVSRAWAAVNVLPPASDVAWNAVNEANNETASTQTWEYGRWVTDHFERFTTSGAGCPPADVGLPYPTTITQCDFLGANRIRQVNLVYDAYDQTIPSQPVHLYPGTLSLESHDPLQTLAVRWIAPVGGQFQVIATFLNSMEERIADPATVGIATIRVADKAVVSAPLDTTPGLVELRLTKTLPAGESVDFTYAPQIAAGGVAHAALTVQVLRLDGYKRQ